MPVQSALVTAETTTVTREAQEILLDHAIPGWRHAPEQRGERRVCCPLHDDQHPSLRLRLRGAGWIWHCDPCNLGGGTWDLACRVLGEETARNALRDMSSGGSAQGRSTAAPQPDSSGSSRTSGLNTGNSTELNPATSTPSDSISDTPDMTLAAYAEAKRLDPNFLKRLGCFEQRYQRGTAVAIPYFDEGGMMVSTQYRLRLEGDGRFRWRTGSKPIPYGLQRIANARALGSVVMVEGASDAQTLLQHGIPALGIPGASTWKPEFAVHLEDIGTIFAVKEPGKGGDTFIGSLLADTAIRDRLRVVRLPTKDVNELHVQDSDRFQQAFGECLEQSTLAVEEERIRAEELEIQRSGETFEKCRHIAEHPAILDLVVQTLHRCGIVGDARLAKLVYLSTTSRLLPHIVSIVAKGPSSAGKSYETNLALALFPEQATYSMTGMSPRALAYDEEPLSNRMLVINEASGLEDDFAAYLLRSLLSEGRLRYLFVEKTADGLATRCVERAGPTGCIITTTSIMLHPENETRMLSVPIDDTTEQTRRIIEALAQEDGRPEVDLCSWHAFQEWLALGETRVVVPFGRLLAQQTRVKAVRQRRDFRLLLSLVRAHALLHRTNRQRDDEGRIVAVVDDYEVVYGLAGDLLGEAAEASVSETIRETVAAVADLTAKDSEVEVRVVDVAGALGLEKDATFYRVRKALRRGYLVNREQRKGRPYRLAVGEPLPDEAESLLPDPSLVRQAHEEDPGAVEVRVNPSVQPLSDGNCSEKLERLSGGTGQEEAGERHSQGREREII